jgi:hypothetical protein
MNSLYTNIRLLEIHSFFILYNVLTIAKSEISLLNWFILDSTINIYSVTYRKNLKKIVAPTRNWMLLFITIKF